MKGNKYEPTTAYFDVLPNTLRKLMRENGTTQQDLATAIGKTRQAVGYYCDGTSSPDWKTIIKIADYFNVTCDYILRGIESDQIDVCNSTGLSNEAVQILRDLKEKDLTQYADCISYLLIQEEMSPVDEFPEYFYGNAETPQTLIDAQRKWEDKQLVPIIDILWDYIRTRKTQDDFAIGANGSIKKLDSENNGFGRLSGLSLDGLRIIKGNAIIEQVLTSEIHEKLQKLHDRYSIECQEQKTSPI